MIHTKNSRLVDDLPFSPHPLRLAVIVFLCHRHLFFVLMILILWELADYVPLVGTVKEDKDQKM